MHHFRMKSFSLSLATRKMFRIFGVVVVTILLIVLNKTYLSEAAPFPLEREDQQVGHF